jgi:hypothetical protein
MSLSLSSRDWIYKAAVTAAFVGATYYCAAFIYIVACRINYPFALEWLEGGSFLQVHRILTGQVLYARPGIEYVAMIYPPFYYYVSAAAARLIGFGFLPLRLVSLASTLGCIGLIYVICRREGTGRVPAFIASALFIATYHLCGTWFDVARVDMLSVFLVLVSIWLLRLQSPKASVAAGFTFALAALTKQTHLITLACLTVYMLVFDRKRSLGFVLSFLIAYGGIFLFLDRLYSGWFKFFVLTLAAGSGEFVSFAPSTAIQTALSFWENSIVLALPIVVLVILMYLVTKLRQRDQIKGVLFFVACAVGMIGTSWSVIQLGGYRNDLVPAYAAMAILFGLSLEQLCGARSLSLSYKSTAFAACALQFVLLHYPISPQIPTNEDLLAGEALVSEIRSQPGDVYVPFHPELALMANKAAFASWSPIYQLEGNFGGGNVRETARVKAEFGNAMARREFSIIILDQTPNWIWGHPEKYYSVSSEPVFSSPGVFWPVTGWAIRPTILMVPMTE